MIKRLADKALKWYCHPDFYPDIKGDLEELYADHVEENRKLAQLKYLADVVMLFRVSLLRPLFKNSIIKDTGMLRNYFKISVRNLARHKMFTVINVIGLAIGLASFLLMYEYIKFEQGYDSFHNDPDQLQRVSYIQMINGVEGDKDAMAAYPVGHSLQDELPEVIGHTVSKKFDFIIFKNNNTSFREKHVISADPNFLKIFNYQILDGDLETMLSEPSSIVLTESRAKAYFGSADPMGQILEAVSPYTGSFKVTGILQDVPDNTHYKFDMLLSDKTLADGQDYEKWNWNNYYMYIKTEKGTDLAKLEVKANQALNDRMNDVEDGESWESNGSKLDIHPVKDIHLRSDFTYEPQVHGSEKSVNFLIIISIFILVIAWVNYINLSTARALNRAKEVGLRKVIGAVRKQLIIQFLCEAFIVNVIGAFIALIISEVMVPYFNILVGKEVITHVWNHAPFLFSMIIFTLIGTFAAGFYPALVLSEFRPITVLKGKFKNSKKGVALRKGLVIAQFAASLILIASTLIIYLQVSYMQGRDIGISINQVVNVTIPEFDAQTEEEDVAYKNKMKAFKKRLSDHSAIEAVGASSNLPGGESADINSTTTKLKIVGMTEPTEGTTYIQYNDAGFFDALDMRLIAGRNFEVGRQSDSSAIMVNEAFLVKMNIPDYQAVINEKVQFGTKESNSKYNIVGVVENFNRTSLKQEVEPTLYFFWPNADDLVVELDANNMDLGLAFLEETWQEFYRQSPLSYAYLDQRFAALYSQDKKFGDTFMVFATLAIFIAILGLFGLASFLSIQRSKEVGVRKVLGASQGHILFLFYKDFFILIGMSALVGLPVIYFLMNGWLNNYAFRIEFPWYTSAISLAIVSVFAFFTVGYQTLKIASMNPATTLQYE